MAAPIRVARKLCAGVKLLPDGLGFLIDQIAACIGGSAFSICRTKPTAGSDNLQHLRKMYQSALHEHPIRQTLVLQQPAASASLANCSLPLLALLAEEAGQARRAIGWNAQQIGLVQQSLRCCWQACNRSISAASRGCNSAKPATSAVINSDRFSPITCQQFVLHVGKLRQQRGQLRIEAVGQGGLI